MNLAESQQIEQVRLNFTSDFLMEIAKCINDTDIERAMFRLEVIKDEVDCWSCDDDEGAEILINEVREMLHAKRIA
tara:strand:- start:41 stop:268 length:228 start_codon:yes stop_codon:yes gene_type:complete